MELAACRGMAPRRRGEEDIFFPAKGRQDLARRAKAVCDTCPVTVQCDDHRNRTHSRWGIWNKTQGVTKRGKRTA
ncbi:WhiB family transcription factor [Rhodococcus phage Reynauld]|uniref:WhiB family transcription factor n=1 Tax=Rhodococcus phage Reynauld TaxID=3062845 RepID=A0ACD4UKU5_9CAUD|nr:WhiB family transcription factor [Rhodococcus phage Reynauld]